MDSDPYGEHITFNLMKGMIVMMKTLTNFRRERARVAYNKALERYKAWSDKYQEMIKTKLDLIQSVGVDAANAFEQKNLWIKEKEDKAYQKLQEKKEKFYEIRGF